MKNNLKIVLAQLNPIVGDAISMTLLFADQNHFKRENLFSNLFLLIRSLITDPNMKNISYYVAEAQRENDKINLQKVMPITPQIWIYTKNCF